MRQEQSSYPISYDEFLEVELPKYFLSQANADEALRGLVSVARFWSAVWERCMAKEKKINDDYPYMDAIELCEKYYEYVQAYLQSNPVTQEIDPVLPEWDYLIYASDTNETIDGVDTITIKEQR
jgi:hypothetical protein